MRHDDIRNTFVATMNVCFDVEIEPKQDETLKPMDSGIQVRRKIFNPLAKSCPKDINEA